jgi:hypothetical protein
MAVGGVVAGETGVRVPPPVSVQLTGSDEPLDGVAVTVTDWVAYTAVTSCGLVMVTSIVMGGVTIPLPPLAQLVARARLNKAAANRKLFVMI